jgi:putative chitinase
MTTQREADLLSAAYGAGITSPRELANFMAQVSHESNGLTHLEEGFRYTKGLQTVPVAAARNSPDGEAAHKAALHGKPEALAELMYGGGKMGNDSPGDGYKFRGRGYIQLTGHDNYEAAGKAIGMDLVNHPELAATPEGATKTALYFWNQNVHAVAPEDVDRATFVINKGGLGLSERREHFAEWESRLTPQVMAGLARGEMNLPVSDDAVRPKGHGGHALRQGDHGEQVGALQAKLGTLGYYNDLAGQPRSPDHTFGPQTAEGVRALQRDHHLEQDGVVGPATHRAIDESIQTRAVSEARGSLRLDDTAHPDHAFFSQACSHVYRLDQELGRAPDQMSNNLACALTVQARTDGLQRIDQVALSTDGSRLWAVQIPPGRTDHLFDIQTSIPTDAVHTSVEQSSAQWPQAMQQYEALQQQPSPSHALAQDQPAQAPVLSR